jgi:hypothetical protein
MQVWDAIVSKEGKVEWIGTHDRDGYPGEFSPEAWYGSPSSPGVDPQRGAALLKLLSDAPKPSPGAVRITVSLFSCSSPSPSTSLLH